MKIWSCQKILFDSSGGGPVGVWGVKAFKKPKIEINIYWILTSLLYLGGVEVVYFLTRMKEITNLTATNI